MYDVSPSAPASQAHLFAFFFTRYRSRIQELVELRPVVVEDAADEFVDVALILEAFRHWRKKGRWCHWNPVHGTPHATSSFTSPFSVHAPNDSPCIIHPPISLVSDFASYNNAYADLGLAEILAPYAQLEMMCWDPLALDQDGDTIEACFRNNVSRIESDQDLPRGERKVGYGGPHQHFSSFKWFNAVKHHIDQVGVGYWVLA